MQGSLWKSVAVVGVIGIGGLAVLEVQKRLEEQNGQVSTESADELAEKILEAGEQSVEPELTESEFDRMLADAQSGQFELDEPASGSGGTLADAGSTRLRTPPQQSPPVDTTVHMNEVAQGGNPFTADAADPRTSPQEFASRQQFVQDERVNPADAEPVSVAMNFRTPEDGGAVNPVGFAQDAPADEQPAATRSFQPFTTEPETEEPSLADANAAPDFSGDFSPQEFVPFNDEAAADTATVDTTTGNETSIPVDDAFTDSSSAAFSLNEPDTAAPVIADADPEPQPRADLRFFSSGDNDSANTQAPDPRNAPPELPLPAEQTSPTPAADPQQTAQFFGGDTAFNDSDPTPGPAPFTEDNEPFGTPDADVPVDHETGGPGDSFVPFRMEDESVDPPAAQPDRRGPQLDPGPDADNSFFTEDPFPLPRQAQPIRPVSEPRPVADEPIGNDPAFDNPVLNEPAPLPLDRGLREFPAREREPVAPLRTVPERTTPEPVRQEPLPFVEDLRGSGVPTLDPEPEELSIPIREPGQDVPVLRPQPDEAFGRPVPNPADAGAGERPASDDPDQPFTEDILGTPVSPDDAHTPVPDLAPAGRRRPGGVREFGPDPGIQREPVEPESPTIDIRSREQMQLDNMNLPRIDPGRGRTRLDFDLGNTPSRPARGSGIRQVAGIMRPNVVLEKDAPGNATVGTPLEYRIFVRNDGDATAYDVVVEDEVPAGLQVEAASPRATQDRQTNRLVWEFEEVLPGDQKEIIVRVTPTGEGTIDGVATVRFKTRVKATTVITAPRLRLQMNGPDEVRLGDEVVYRYVITNEGSGEARDVYVRTILPEEGGLKHPAGRDLEYEIQSLKPDEQREIVLKVVAAEPGDYRAQAEVTAAGGSSDQAAWRTNIVGAQLKINRRGPKRRFVGRPGVYENIVSNETNFDAFDARIVELVPEGMRFIRASGGGQYDQSTGKVTWQIDRLDAGAVETLQIELMPTQAGARESIVTVFENAGIQSEDHVSTTQVEDLHNVSADISQLDGPVAVGETFGFAISIDNRGTADATDVELSVSVPPEIKVVGAGSREVPAQLLDGNRVQYKLIVRIPPDERQRFELKLQGQQPVRNGVVKAAVRYKQMTEPLVVSESVTIYRDDL